MSLGKFTGSYKKACKYPIGQNLQLFPGEYESVYISCRFFVCRKFPYPSNGDGKKKNQIRFRCFLYVYFEKPLPDEL